MKEFGYEIHHIIPRSMGGDNTDENLVKLNRREHLLCHRLLTKFLSGHNKYKMMAAYSLMTKCGNAGRSVYINKLYSCSDSYNSCFNTLELKNIGIDQYIVNSKFCTKEPAFRTKEGFFLLRLAASVYNKGFSGLNIPITKSKIDIRILQSINHLVSCGYLLPQSENNMRGSKYFMISDKLKTFFSKVRVISDNALFLLSISARPLRGFVGALSIKEKLKECSKKFPEMFNVALMSGGGGKIRIRPMTTGVIHVWPEVEDIFSMENISKEF